MKKFTKALFLVFCIFLNIGLFSFLTTSAEAATSKPSRPVISVKADKKAGRIKVTIEETKRATNYRIYVKEKGQDSYRKVKNLKKDGTEVRSYTIKNLTPGKTYYVKVVAVNKIDGKAILSKFSKAKKIKLSKSAASSGANGATPTAPPEPTATATPEPTKKPKVTDVPTDTPVPTEVPTEELPPYPTPKPFVKPDGEHHGLDYFSRDNLPEGYSSQEELSLEMNDYTYKYFKKVAKYYGYEISEKCTNPRIVELKNYSTFFYTVVFTKDTKVVEIEYGCSLSNYINALNFMGEAFRLDTYSIKTADGSESGLCLARTIDDFLK